jgi:hypothetical protein
MDLPRKARTRRPRSRVVASFDAHASSFRLRALSGILLVLVAGGACRAAWSTGSPGNASPPGPPCTPGSQVACPCFGGETGVQVCSGDGASFGPCVCQDAGASDGGILRDPLLQPFAPTSIWNMPIGSKAEYVAANIAPLTRSALQGDEDIIILSPSSPSTPVFKNPAGWDNSVSRCPYNMGGLLFDVPMPSSFIVGDTPVSSTPNAALAALAADGRTLRQTQPFARCTAGEPATSEYVAASIDLYGDGTVGAHGGSGLSSIGGTLRLGELRPGGPLVRHALKAELFGEQNYYNDGVPADCYRWPATRCDGPIAQVLGPLDGAPNPGKYYGGSNPSLRPGSLLAIPANVSVANLALETEPARSLAWTLQNYGAYVVDDSGWPSMNLCVEAGPSGSFKDQFASDWGFSFNTDGTTSPFARDILAIVSALSIVDNNDPSSVGGGGAPLQPLAAPLPPGPPGADD